MNKIALQKLRRHAIYLLIYYILYSLVFVLHNICMCVCTQRRKTHKKCMNIFTLTRKRGVYMLLGCCFFCYNPICRSRELLPTHPIISIKSFSIYVCICWQLKKLKCIYLPLYVIIEIVIQFNLIGIVSMNLKGLVSNCANKVDSNKWTQLFILCQPIYLVTVFMHKNPLK